jgi:hypothetical protein
MRSLDANVSSLGKFMVALGVFPVIHLHSGRSRVWTGLPAQGVFIVLLAGLPGHCDQWLFAAFVPFTAAGQRENRLSVHSSSLTSSPCSARQPSPGYSFG